MTKLASGPIRTMRQSDLSFTVAAKFQTVWGSREAAVFMLEGVGVTTFLGFMLFEHVPGMMVSAAAVAAAVVLLLSHLGHPLRAWRAIVNIRRSWISRGTLAIGSFVALAVARILFMVFGGAEYGGIITAIDPALFVLGVFILLYPGFAMAASKGIAFWCSGLLPVLSMAQGLATGFVILAAALNAVWPDAERAAIMLLVLHAAFTGTYLVTMANGPLAGRLSVQHLLKDELLLFWVLGIAVGIAKPILILSLTDLPVALAIATLARIVGDAALRFVFLRAGAYAPVV